MITETAIPTVFQVVLTEVAEVGPAEEVDEGETVGFREVLSGVVESTDDETVRVPDEVDGAAADLVDADGIRVWVCVDEGVDEAVDNAEERVVVGPSSGNRMPSRLGKRALVVVVAVRGVEGVGVVVLTAIGR